VALNVLSTFDEVTFDESRGAVWRRPSSRFDGLAGNQSEGDGNGKGNSTCAHNDHFKIHTWLRSNIDPYPQVFAEKLFQAGIKFFGIPRFRRCRPLSRVEVNSGGDIAFAVRHWSFNNLDKTIVWTTTETITGIASTMAFTVAVVFYPGLDRFQVQLVV